MRKTILRTLTVIPMLLTAASTLHAQCIIPDNLDGGPCCDVTKVHLPVFPKFQQEMLDITWHSCQAEQTRTRVVSWDSPNPFGNPCGGFRSRVSIMDPAGLVWYGKLNLTYARTWAEQKVNGELMQVWRFLVNGDMLPGDAAGAIPPCAGAVSKGVRFTGYVDWARTCQTQEWENAWMLTHSCDGLDHIAGFPRAGAFHPDESYTFVGPASGFSISTALTLGSGGGLFESMRRIHREYIPGTFTFPRCVYEERATSQITTGDRFCGCSPGGTMAQYEISQAHVQGGCGSQASTTSSEMLPGSGIISMSIGTWTDPNIYPGVEGLLWNVAEYTYADACTAKTQVEIFYGVATLGGFDARSITVNGIHTPLPSTFLDQANSIRRKKHKTVGNIPFVSSHIINLNLD